MCIIGRSKRTSQINLRMQPWHTSEKVERSVYLPTSTCLHTDGGTRNAEWCWAEMPASPWVGHSLTPNPRRAHDSLPLGITPSGPYLFNGWLAFYFILWYHSFANLTVRIWLQRHHHSSNLGISANMFVEMRHDSNLLLSSTRSHKRRNERVEASLPEASPLDNIDFGTFFNYLYTFIKSKLIMQAAVKTQLERCGLACVAFLPCRRTFQASAWAAPLRRPPPLCWTCRWRAA